MRRIRLNQDVRASFSAGMSQGEGLLYNVSSGGFFVFSPVLMPPGSHVTAVFRTTSGGLGEAEGQVCWNTAAPSAPPGTSGFGVRLTRADAGYRRLVDAILDEPGTPRAGDRRRRAGATRFIDWVADTSASLTRAVRSVRQRRR